MPELVQPQPVPVTGEQDAGVKSAGVVCDGYRVIFSFCQALSAGMVSVEVTSSPLEAVSGTAVTRERARTSSPR